MPKKLLAWPVVFGFVNPGALAILLAVDLAAFLRRERSAVGLALGLDLMMNRALPFLQMRGLARRERAVLYAFPDALLLVALPLIDLVILR